MQGQQMINNFYFTPAEGPLVAYGKIHIGKDQLFWEFRFKAYRESGGVRAMRVDSESGLSIEVNIPPLTVESYAAWRSLLRSTRGTITDQRGGLYSIDEFEARVMESAPRTENGKRLLLNWLEEAKADPQRLGRGINRELVWCDAEGFCFSLCAF
jgi:hypothetical protein